MATKARLLFGLVTGMLIAGCTAPVLDQRQITNDQSFGFAFTAEVIEVLIVKARIEPHDRFSRVGATAARLTAEDAFAGRPLLEFIAELYAAVGEALVGEAEEIIRSTRCMYFARPLETGTFDKIQREILVQQSESLRDFLDGFSPEDRDDLSLTPADLASEWPVLTLPQACDERILPGTSVILTYSLSGGTIHPATPAFQNLPTRRGTGRGH